jgi:threonyl-tRNA synthetase
MVIIGDKEVDSKTVTVRLRDGENLSPMSLREFIDYVTMESKIPVVD